MLTPHNRIRIAAHAVVDPRTVERIYKGARTNPNVRTRVSLAAEELGLPLPPEPPPSNPPEAL